MAFVSYTLEEFWKIYSRMPLEIQKLADKQFALFSQSPFHPSLQLKSVKEGVWSAGINQSYRAVAWREGTVFHWFWIGPHHEYDKLLKRLK